MSSFADEHEQLIEVYSVADKERKHAQELYQAARTYLEEKDANWKAAAAALDEFERRHKR